MVDYPLVSCICPTYNRPHYLLRAIYIFFKQDYPNKELIIVDDSDKLLISKIPKMNNVTYIKLKSREILGTKRNIAVKHARGDIFIFWDDDDIYSTKRISKQVMPIIDSKADITLFNNIVYHELCSDTYFKTSQKDHLFLWYKGYICGTMASKKSFWLKDSFKKKS
jgi:glycosyltransferase involved in cell wall biosynthesis